ncbi:MAG: S8 family serine peptidase [Cyanobacteria bacterium P01_F01_bin.143]
MDINTLSLQGNKSSAISDVLLQLENFNTDSNSVNNDNFVAVNQDLLIFDENIGRVAVRITAHDINALTPFLDNVGFETLGSAPEHHLIEGYVPVENISHLEALADEGLIMGVIPVYRPVTNVGLTDSQADFVHEADRVRAALPNGFEGTGQTIAVFSDSYDVSGDGSEAADIASGDLPTGVNVLQEFTGTGIDEGRAMLQLIHDLVPGADLVFSSFFFGEANAAQQIRNAANPAIGNATVLVDDIGFLTSPFFQDGIVAQAVDEVVTNEGVTYFSSAGNSSANSYESTNINFTPDSGGGFSNSFYDFDFTAGVDSRQEIILAPNQTFRATLQWDDPYYTANGVDTDLLFGLIDSSNIVYAVADENNIANQTPFEFLNYTNTTGATQTLEVIITKEAGPDPTRLKYINVRNHNPTEYDTNSSTVFGQNSATNAQAVAALPFFDQDTPEPFTSEGPTTIIFDPNGTRKTTPEIRQTPDIAAIDGTNTTFFGDDILDDILEDADTFPNFFGTSAAAPHAAAVAALIQQANPSFTPHQVYDRLQSTAKDIAPVGFDNVTGFGLINAYDAIFGPPVPASLPFVENFNNGDLPLAFETNSTTSGRIQVTSDFSPLGARQLTLDSSAEGFGLSLNEAILHLDTTGFTDVLLSFQQKEFGDEDDVMPTTFVGSNNSDGVALSVDGINWTRLVSLTGTNSLSSFQLNSFNLTAIATANGLTLGSDVQIKFQQFDNFPLTLDGFAFDNISVTGTPISTCNPTSGDDDLTSCATPEADIVNGRAGDDTLVGGNGNDTLLGKGGSDLISGGNNNDRLVGGNGNDTLVGGAGPDILFGENNNDRLVGGNGNDTLIGGNGADRLFGENNNDRLVGGNGNDTLVGGAGPDILFGEHNNDRLVGGSGSDTLIGGTGSDILLGETNNDRLVGGNGNDTLIGGTGSDILFGEHNNDRLVGENGNDTLVGGLGLDTLIGGTGSDRFRIASAPTASRDIIQDFTDGIDFLDLTGSLGFSDLTINQNGTSTNIIETATNQILAVLQNTDADDITLADFV